jgi:hypothetical protein
MAVCHSAYKRARKDRKLELVEEFEPESVSVPFTDTALAGLERSLAVRASVCHSTACQRSGSSAK